MQTTSLVQTSETDYLVFGLPYTSNLLLELSPKGVQTLDGNTNYYYQKRFYFDPEESDYVAKNFKNFHSFDKNISKCIMVPVEYHNLAAKTTNMVQPKPFDLSDPCVPLDVLCIPFRNNVPMNFGFYSAHRGSFGRFARSASFITLNILTDRDIRKTLNELFNQNSK